MNPTSPTPYGNPGVAAPLGIMDPQQMLQMLRQRSAQAGGIPQPMQSSGGGGGQQQGGGQGGQAGGQGGSPIGQIGKMLGGLGKPAMGGAAGAGGMASMLGGGPNSPMMQALKEGDFQKAIGIMMGQNQSDAMGTDPFSSAMSGQESWDGGSLFGDGGMPDEGVSNFGMGDFSTGGETWF